MSTVPPNFIVGIGGSAGSLNEFKAILNAVPSDTGMAFVVVAHLMADANSMLVEILSRHIKMKVLLASTDLAIQANHVYVIPPNADLTIESNTFKVVSPRTQKNKQIDMFFTSLAEVMGSHAIGIIVSGYDGDGTEGCKKIKAKGGVTFAQDATAEIADMPLSAQASGCIDFVLPAKQISDKLSKIAKHVSK
jgi:two-component system CheB/CheR fusion protein